MRVSRYAFVLFCWCVGCDGAETHGGGDDSGEPDDGGLDAANEDAGGMAGTGGSIGLTPDQIATPEAIEDIAALECGTFDACGGEPVGTWNVRSVCVQDALNIATRGLQNCADLLVAYERTASGTVALLPDGTLEMDLTIEGTQELRLHDACAERIYGGVASDEVCATYEEQLNGNANEPAASCALDGDACACDVAITNSLMFSGTFTVEDNTIQDGSGPAPFCVDGDELTIEYGTAGRRIALTFERAATD